MMRYMMGLLLVALVALPARAHFIWIVPDGPEGTRARLVFSENLQPDASVPVDKIAATKLSVRAGTGKAIPLGWKQGEHAYLLSLPDKDPAVVGGVCTYGVLQRGQAKPFLLAYHPKWIRGEVAAAKSWDQLALEIVPQGGGRFQVLFAGKPAAGAEVVILTPAGDSQNPLNTDTRGEFKVSLPTPGLHGIRARHIEAKTGEHEGKKYEEVRHYATLVFRVALGRQGKAPADAAVVVPSYPALPRAVSSFGAAVANGWLYVYGGHCARTHHYSTEAVVGTFHRLNLAESKAWEPLPSGPPVQGLAVVAHRGKVYRIGGMQPRNQPGEPADNHSLTTCARFDPAAGKWEPLPDLPVGRSSHDAVVVGDKLVVVGGWNMGGAGRKTTWHTTALVLDLARPPLKWEAIRQPFQRRALTAAVHEGKVYVVGGMTPEAATALTVNVYDPVKDAWTTGPDLPGPRRNGFAPAAIAAGDRLYVSPADGRLLRLAVDRGAWEEVGQLKQPRIVHRLIAVHDKLLVALGGASKGDNVALTETIIP